MLRQSAAMQLDGRPHHRTASREHLGLGITIVSESSKLMRAMNRFGRRPVAIGAIILGLAAAAALAPAAAQVVATQVVVVVNGEPITNFDIDQRAKFTALSTHKTPARKEVLDELVDEKLKVQVTRRYKLDITDKDVDSSYADMAQRMHMNTDQLTKILASNGIQPDTLKSRIRSEVAWTQFIRGRYAGSFQIREKDVLEAMQKGNKGESETTGYEYTIRPILFLVVQKSGESMESRRKEAEALRGRFQNCVQGVALARAMRDVTVRETIVKTSADLVPALREILDKTPVGTLTPPEVTAQGIQIFAVCNRRETKVDTQAKKETQSALLNETFNTQSKKLLQELRRSAMIEVK
jgi:peptidyl-prolyl cis-trans isomerase SurA